MAAEQAFARLSRYILADLEKDGRDTDFNKCLSWWECYSDHYGFFSGYKWKELDSAKKNLLELLRSRLNKTTGDEYVILDCFIKMLSIPQMEPLSRKSITRIVFYYCKMYVFYRNDYMDIYDPEMAKLSYYAEPE